MNIEKDKLFELMIALLMKRNGYRVGVPSGRFLEGRGGRHQIDCIGIYPFPAPFVFPLRLVAEAKLYDPAKQANMIGIHFVRNLHSTLVDLEQTLPRDRSLMLDERWEENITCNYQGAIFSTSGFSHEAEQYANAFSIDTVAIPERMPGGGSTFDAVEKIAKALNACLDQKSPAFRDMGECDEGLLKKLMETEKYSDLDTEGKGELFKLLEFLVMNCSRKSMCGIKALDEVKGWTEDFFNMKLGSLDGHVIAIQINPEDFKKLRYIVAQNYLNRAEGPDPFHSPPEDTNTPETPRQESSANHTVKINEDNERRSQDNGRVSISLVIDAGGKRIRSSTLISYKMYDGIRSSKHPRKLVIPIDYGCFFYGMA